MKQQMPIGVDDFKELRDENYYFVDKTDFIKQLIDGHSYVTLITRPHRFGKTMMMSMLECFFSIEKADISQKMFEGLSISQRSEYMAYRGQYPVVFISMRDIVGSSWEEMLQSIRKWISKWYSSHDYLRTSEKVDPVFRREFEKLKDQVADLAEMQMSLYSLTHMLYQYYGKSSIILIDDYDAPLQKAWENGFFKNCMAWEEGFLGSALKGNHYLDFGIVTGIFHIVPQGLFSNLNNWDINSLTCKKYSEFFGFTEQEVTELLKNQHMADELAEIREWYGGYRIGEHHIYNPWSVLNCAANGGKMYPYWIQSLQDNMLQEWLQHADKLDIRMVQNLLDGESLRTPLYETISYTGDGGRMDFPTMLFTKGFLTIQSDSPEFQRYYALRIPNKEVWQWYHTALSKDVIVGNGVE